MKKFILISAGAIILSGCATEKNIQMSDTYWRQKNHKTAVAETLPAKPGVTLAGSQGLLDMAINSAMTKKLDKSLKSTDLSWYYAMPNDLAKKLKQSNVKAVMLGSDIKDDDKVIESMAKTSDADDLLVIKLKAVGVIRYYNGFIPSGAPQAYCVLKGELLDASTRQVKWRHLAEVKVPVQGQWDQPPTYPNVSVAVKEAISASRDEVMNSFFSGR